MKRIAALLAVACCAAMICWGQVSLQAPEINAETEDGAMIAEAASAADTQTKIGILEKFVNQFPDSKYIGYALLQLQNAYVETKQNEKTVEAGKRLIELAPDNIEVRHNTNQALVALQRWDELYPMLVETKPLAEKVASAPKPADADAGTWQGQVDYASGVSQYVEWAMNAAMTQQADPKQKVRWLDVLRENYPDGEYAKGLTAQYVAAYQQQGDITKAVEWAQKAVDDGAVDETYEYLLAEGALNNQDNAAAKEHAEKALSILAAKEKPANISEEQWAAQKARMEAYAKFDLGRAWVAGNTKDDFRTARASLLESVDVLKAEGGPRYEVLAYLLGVCYVQLDIRGDNIQKALFWMTEAANSEGPYQAQAKEALTKIKAAM